MPSFWANTPREPPRTRRAKNRVFTRHFIYFFPLKRSRFAISERLCQGKNSK